MNQNITNAMKTRDSYHKNKNMEQYKIWRNKCKNLVQKSKTDFYIESWTQYTLD